jgi:hypothetical protein
MTQNTISNTFETRLHEQILKVCHKIELNLHDNLKGPKIYTNYQRVGLIVLFVRSRKALRDFISELFESKWPSWLGLRDIPGKSTLQRWLKKWSVSWVRSLLQQTTTEPKRLAIDATGIDSWQRSRHYERRLKEFGLREKYMPYAKADILVDTESKQVFDFVLRMKPRHDVLGARTIFNRLKHEGLLILADKGYDSEKLHAQCEEKGNLMFAPVRDFKVKRPKGKNRRRCVEGCGVKGRRSIVESVIRSLKVRIVNLRSKLHYMKKREFGWHMVAYNLEKRLWRFWAIRLFGT